jgi:diguanylate cyclase (GGDEF)-like protein
VLVIDLDRFQDINDNYGHAVGDELLRALATVLGARGRATDVIGRLGGDEFGVILPHSRPAEATATAQALVGAIRTGCVARVHGRDVYVTASIGLRVVAAGAHAVADELLAEAHIALRDAKDDGRDRVSAIGHDSAKPDRVRARLTWSEQIRDALEHDRLTLYEQPIVALASGAVDRTEVLLRMVDDDGSGIAPGAFLEIAERFGQIQELDRWVIARAVQLLEDRHAAGIDLGIEVNLSGASITDPHVIDFIVSVINRADVDPTRLTFEVTETAAIEEIDRARELSARLADLGCHFALDDFGSGFGTFYCGAGRW